MQKWWPLKKGFAVNLGLSAYAGSTVLYAPAFDHLLSIEAIGLDGTLRIISLFLLVMLSLLGMFIVLPEGKDDINHAQQKVLFTPGKILRTKEYYLIVLGLLFLMPMYYLVIPFLKITGLARGLSQATIITLIMVTGIMAVLGRFICPKLTDTIGSPRVMIMLYTIVIACAALFGFAQGISFFVVVMFVSFVYGGCAGIISILASDYFGAENLSGNLGLFMIIFMIMGLFSPGIVYWIEATGEYMLFSSLVPLVLGVAGLLISIYLKRSARKNKQGVRSLSNRGAGA